MRIRHVVDNRIILTIVIPLVTVFIVLAMSNPYPDCNQGQKLRPCAVIQEDLSSSDQSVPKYCVVAAIHFCMVSFQKSQTVPWCYHDENPPLLYTPENSLPTRAPPLAVTIPSGIIPDPFTGNDASASLRQHINHDFMFA